MKYNPKKVFILDDGKYIELTYQDFCNRKDSDVSYDDRRFIPIQGMLMEVSSEAYKDFYRDKERYRYIKKLDIENKLLSIDEFDSEDDNGTDFIFVQTDDVSEIVSNSIMLQKLRQSISELNADEKELIYQHYFDEISESKLGELYNKLKFKGFKYILKKAKCIFFVNPFHMKYL